MYYSFFRSWLLHREGGAGFYRTPEAKEERRKKKGNMERKKEKTKQLFFSRHILTFPLLLVTLQDSFPYKKVGRPPRGKINAFSHAFYGFCLFLSLFFFLPLFLLPIFPTISSGNCKFQHPRKTNFPYLVAAYFAWKTNLEKLTSVRVEAPLRAHSPGPPLSVLLRHRAELKYQKLYISPHCFPQYAMCKNTKNCKKR